MVRYQSTDLTCFILLAGRSGMVAARLLSQRGNKTTDLVTAFQIHGDQV
jgi:hypothetical protein